MLYNLYDCKRTKENNKVLLMRRKEKETRYVQIKFFVLPDQGGKSFFGEENDLEDWGAGSVRVWHLSLYQVG